MESRDRSDNAERIAGYEVALKVEVIVDGRVDELTWLNAQRVRSSKSIVARNRSRVRDLLSTHSVSPFGRSTRACGHTYSRPCARSEIKSSTFSMPIEMRISASDSPISSRNSRATPECVIEAGCEISVSVPPKLTASFMI